MKRFFVFLMLFLVVNSVYSQQRDEWYWDESTKDAVYETPNSKFAKKWYRTPYNEPEQCLHLLANGTFKYQASSFNEIHKIYIKITFSGTWSRKDKMVLELHYTYLTCVGDPNMLSKLSARKRDEINKYVKGFSAKSRANVIGKTDRYELKRIDNDHLIMDNEHWMSENLRNKY